jgi:hypothetical protein
MWQIRDDNEDSDCQELKGRIVMAKTEPEYREGSEAGENFRKLATALFQTPKDGRKNRKRQPKKATSRKSRGSGKS